MPGPILLRDGSFVYINYGERFEDPYDIEYHQERGVFLLKENGETLEEVDFVPRPAFFGKKTSRGTPMEALADVRGAEADPYRLSAMPLLGGRGSVPFLRVFHRRPQHRGGELPGHL